MLVNIISTNTAEFFFNGAKYVKNFLAVKSGDNVRITNAYDTKFSLCSEHYSNYTVDGNSFNSSLDLVNALAPLIFVKDVLQISGYGESSNATVTAVFDNILGTWVNTPSSAGSGNIALSTAGAVNGGVAAVYYKGDVLDENSFTGGTVTIMSGQNVDDELCLVWIVYDKGNNAFHVNIQTGFTGSTPPPSGETAPVITVTNPGGETPPTITVT